MSDHNPSGRTVTAQEILEELNHAVIDHMVWLKDWHRALLCGQVPAPDASVYDPDDLGRFGVWYLQNQHLGLVNQPVIRNLADHYQDLRTRAQELMSKAAGGTPLNGGEYDAFMDMAGAFVAQARRLEKAFAAASSHLDPLTGLHNRQAMATDLERERERFIRTRYPCCVALSDIDHFKKVNDDFGHTAGDKVLFDTAECFLQNMRPYDSVYRYGGEEFLFCLLDTTADNAQKVMDRLREFLARTVIKLDGGKKLTITASFGIAQMEDNTSVQKVIQRADEALYAAKQAGRNQVHVWQSAENTAET